MEQLTLYKKQNKQSNSPFQKLKSPLVKTPIKKRTLFIKKESQPKIMLEKKDSITPSHQTHLDKNKLQLKSQKNLVQYCQNHPDLQAFYTILVEGQQLSYCKLCGKQLISQGFSVLEKKQSYQKLQNTKPQKEQEIRTLFSNLQQLQVQGQNCRTILQSRKQKIISHYKLQITCIENYYKKIIKFIQDICQETMEGMEEMMRKNIQEIDIYQGECKDYQSQMEIMAEDLQTNFDRIISGLVNEQIYRKIMEDYHKKCLFFNHKLEQFNSQCKQIYYSQITQDMLQKFADNFTSMYDITIHKGMLKDSVDMISIPGHKFKSNENMNPNNSIHNYMSNDYDNNNKHQLNSKKGKQQSEYDDNFISNNNYYCKPSPQFKNI